MKRERDYFKQIQPVLSYSNPWVVTSEYIDTYGDHLNQAKALTIFETERLKALSKEKMLKHGVLAVINEQHAKYIEQVYENEMVEVSTNIYVDGVRLYFMQKMHRQGLVVVDDLVEAAMINNLGRATRIPEGFIKDLSVGSY